MAWTDDRVDHLRELWSKGLSASQIAAQLGDGVTRNAVIGKAHRLGLEGRPSPIRGGGSGNRVRRRTRKPLLPSHPPTVTEAERAIRSRIAERVPSEPGLEIPTASIRKEIGLSTGPHCLWPIGDPGDADFRFCGHTAHPGRPYCPEHCAIAYINKDRTAA